MIILTGPTAAGKNSVATYYANQVENSCIEDYDAFHRMFINPHLAPWSGGEGRKQQELGIEATANCANIFEANGCSVIVLDVITSSTLTTYRKFLKNNNFKIIQLLPSFEETKVRFLTRGRCLTDQEFDMVYKSQTTFNEYDLRIDNSCLNLKEVSDRISRYLLK